MSWNRIKRNASRSISLSLICLTLLNSVFPAALPGTASAAELSGDAQTAQAAGIQGFMVSAAAEQTAVKTGAQAAFTVKVAAGAGGEAALSLQVKGPAGNVVAQQQYPKGVFAAGEERTFAFAWNVPDGVPTGLYTVGVRVTDGAGKAVYTEQPQLLKLEVQPPVEAPAPNAAARYTAAAFASPYLVKAGSKLTGTAVVTSTLNTTVQVNVDLYNALGTKVHGHTYNNQVMLANKKYLFPIAWSVPADAKPGLYKAAVSVSKPGGAELYERNVLTGYFVVTDQVTPPVGDTYPPAVPVGVTAAETGDGFVKLRWNPVTTLDTAGYKVYVTSEEEGWSREVLAGQAAGYTAAGLKNGAAYRFTVTALDYAGNESAKSAAVSAAPIDKIAPAAPQGLQAKAGDQSVKLSWTANTEKDLAGYKLFSSLDGGTTWDAGVHVGSVTSYTVDKLINDQAYTFALTAYDNSDNMSPKSAAASATPIDLTPPDAPGEITATAQDGSVLVKWSAAEAADLKGYTLYVSADGGMSWQPGIEAGSALEYKVSGLTNDTEYTFAVTASDKAGNTSAKSVFAKATPVDLTAPNAPGSLQAEAGNGQVTLQWTASSAEEGVKGYNIYVSTDGGTNWLAPVNAGHVTQFTVSGLTNDTAYTFAVTAFDARGNESAKSTSTTATPKDNTPAVVPAGLTATAGDASVELLWTPVIPGGTTQLVKYTVYMSSDNGATWNAGTAVGINNSYSVSGLTNGTAYTFAVTATYSSGKESAKSATATATPQPSNVDRTPPAVPVIMMGIPESNAAVLVWSKVMDADLAKYKIYKSTDGGTSWDMGILVDPVTMYYYGGLKGGTAYTFAMTSIDASGNESAKSASVTVIPVAGPDRTPPAVPTGLAAVAGSKTANVTWNAVSDDDLQSYYIYVTNTATGGFNRIYTGTATSYKVTNLTNNVEYTIQVSAMDTNNNESARSAGVKIKPSSSDTTAPAVPAGLQITDVRDGMLSLRWNEIADADKDHYNVYVSTDQGTTWRPAQQARTAAFLASGLMNGTKYTFAVSAVDINDNESAKSALVSGTPSKYIVPQGLTASAGEGEVKLGWTAVTAADLKEYRVYTSMNGGSSWNTGVSVGKTARYTAKPLTNGQLYTFAVTAVRTDNAESIKSEPVSAKPDTLRIPPDPGTIAPSLPDTNTVSFKDSVSFLYTGLNPVQYGVTPGVLREEQMSVVTGKVQDTEGSPIPGVKVTVLNHNDYGMTASRLDGAYDIVVNGGKGITLQFEKAGYMTVQRKAPADWNEFHTMPDVVLKPYDTKVTEVTLSGSTEVQAARGSLVTDEDGSRQAAVLFQPGTTATIQLPDGTVRTLDKLNVRATEYTVGDKGEESMPGEIPSSVAYTYAVELSADEAVAAGATRLDFNKPVYVYVDNFLDLQVGSIVPSGYYNLKQGAWEAEPDGYVVQVVSENGGTAQIDINGDGVAEADSVLAGFGWTPGERLKVAQLYDAGKTLWRVPAHHFSPYDYNQNSIVRPDDRLMPPNDPVDNPAKDKGDGKADPCNDKGSIIGCYSQTLGQSIPIQGTSLSLDYHSDLTAGYKLRGEIEVPVTDGRSLSSQLMMADVTVTVAGKTMKQTFAVSSLTKNLKAKFTWDGLDRYGRKLIGEQPYTAIVSYHYPSTMYIGTLPPSGGGGGGSGGGSGGGTGGTRSFGQAPSMADSTGYFRQGRDNGLLNRQYNGYMVSPNNPYEETGIAGWKLSSQDMLLNLDQGYRTEQMNGTAEGISIPSSPGNVVGPDGSFYVKKGSDLYRILPDGNGAEKAETLRSAQDELIAYGADGTMYAKDVSTQNVYRKRAGETFWTHFAGNGTARPLGTPEYYEDGTPATSISWSSQFTDYEVGPEGKLYFINDSVLYRVDPNGVMFNYAVADSTVRDDNYLGTGVAEGVSSKENIGSVLSAEIGKDGTIYVLQYHSIQPCRSGCESRGKSVSLIKAIYPTGEVRNVAGVPFAENFESENQETQYNLADGVNASEAIFYTLTFEMDEQGTIYFPDYTSSSLNRNLYKIDQDGVIHSFDRRAVEKVQRITSAEEERDPELINVRLLQAGPGDRVYLFTQVRNVEAMVFYTGSGQNGGETQTWTKPDDSSAYAGVYSLENGRLLRTVSTLTGKTHVSYDYDEAGRLTAIRDFKGETITIARDTNGVPTQIVSAYGQVTQLIVENGQLKQVTSPAGEAYTMEYDDFGLMKQFTDPEQQIKKYGFDDKGLLTRAETPREGVKTLQRSKNDFGYEVKVTDPDQNVMIYKVRNQTGIKSITVQDASGAEITVNEYTALTTKRYQDDSIDFMTFAADPQWGEAYVTHIRSLTHDRQEINQDIKREAVLSDPNNPYSLVSLKTTLTLEGASRTSEYFPAERKVKTVTAEGHQSLIYMDEWDRTVRIEEPGTTIAPILYSYDERGRLKRVEQGNQFLEYTYNAAGLVETVTNAAGYVKTYKYDEANRLKTTITPGKKQYEFGYDAMGNHTSLVMPNGETVSQSYNKDGAFESIRFGNETNGLFVNRTLTSSKDFSTLWSGKTIDYTYEGDQLTGINDTDIQRGISYAPGEKWGRFETVSSVTNNVYKDAQQVKFAYDGLNITATEFTGDANGRFSYSNTKFGLLTNIVSSVTSSVYGNQIRIDAVGYNNDFEVKQAGPYSFGYNGPNKRLDSIDDGQITVSRSYDDMGRVSSIAYTAKGAEIYRVAYTYDLRNFVETKTVVSGGAAETFTYTYDADDQLTDVVRTLNGEASITEHYEYDVNKNRTIREITGAAREISTYGAFDQLQQSGNTAYEFDADGFMTKRGDDTFRYGPKGELLEASANEDFIHYTYDGMGRMTAREDAQGKTQYLYGNRMHPKSVSAAVGPDGVVTWYHYDLSGYLLGLERNGIRYETVTDQAGTPVQVLDADGKLVKEMKYDSFGVQLSDTNPSFKLDIGFAGGIADEDTKLVRFGSRDYDPVSARWTARDPIYFDSGQANLYAYVNNNPIVVRDPCGQGCVGGSIYNFVGIGAKICKEGDDWAICGEIGAGFGGGIDIAPGEGLPSNHTAFEVGVKVKGGPASIAGGYEWKREKGSPCVQGSPKLSAGFGPLEVDILSPNESKATGELDDLLKPNDAIGEKFKDVNDNGWTVKNGLEAAAKLKGCKSTKA
ncbi:fibronectin type III domain-containing protein [Paenibacillus gansuensis]|uniref:Fibronectin type III domain-containing protein n=1 Tax=Paenibacillus gansuensis TaxID=306542 RepID=A0ABW5P9T9_9BACL